MPLPDEHVLREAFRAELARLRALGVGLRALGERESHALVARLAEEFVDPDRSLELLMAVDGDRPTVHFEKFLRPDRTTSRRVRGCLDWLAAGVEEPDCARFDWRRGLPVTMLALRTFEESWAGAWPGLLVHFEVGRALAVSVHYEIFQCDLRGGPGSPYR